jgi:hypothetical protein
MYREISPKKIRLRRGDRTRMEVVTRTNGKLSEQDLYAYEHGKWKPSPSKLAYLLAALECGYDEVSEPVDLVLT